MPTVVDIRDARTRLPQLLDRVRAGEEIVLALAGEPCAKLVPVNSVFKRDRKPGLVKGRITDAFFEPLPHDEFSEREP